MAGSARPKTRLVGRVVSAKSKTGDAACSQAMSTWVTTRKSGTTPASVFAILGQCRSKARAVKEKAQQGAARDTARPASQPVNAKDRLERARAAIGVAPSSLREQASHYRAQKGDRAARIAKLEARAREINGLLRNRHRGATGSVDYIAPQVKEGVLPQSQLDYATQRVRGLESRNQSLVNRIRRVAASSPGKTSPPSLREQADRHRAKKGDRAARIEALRGRVRQINNSLYNRRQDYASTAGYHQEGIKKGRVGSKSQLDRVNAHISRIDARNKSLVDRARRVLDATR